MCSCADDNIDSFDSPEKAENVKADIETIIQAGRGGGGGGRGRGGG